MSNVKITFSDQDTNEELIMSIRIENDEADINISANGRSLKEHIEEETWLAIYALMILQEMDSKSDGMELVSNN